MKMIWIPLLALPAFLAAGLHDNQVQVVQVPKTVAAPSPSSWINLQGIDIPDPVNIVGLGIFLLSQIFAAKTTDIFPTLHVFQLSLNTTFYKLKICDRADVKSCMYSGASR
jgi:hypothetical protein